MDVAFAVHPRYRVERVEHQRRSLLRRLSDALLARARQPSRFRQLMMPDGTVLSVTLWRSSEGEIDHRIWGARSPDRRRVEVTPSHHAAVRRHAFDLWWEEEADD